MKYYLDCEFDGLNGPLLSMAMVSETGKGLYAVMSTGASDPWVRANVVPILLDCPLDRIQFCHLGCDARDLTLMLESYFLGDLFPYVIADWPDDFKYFCHYLLTGPGTMINVPEMKMTVKRVDAYPTTLPGAVRHNAWWDAMALRHLLEQPQ